MDIYNDLKDTLKQQYKVKNKMKVNSINVSSNSTREIHDNKQGGEKDISPVRSPNAETILLNRTDFQHTNKQKDSKMESSLSNIDESSI
jgi:hypothetical protein